MVLACLELHCQRELDAAMSEDEGWWCDALARALQLVHDETGRVWIMLHSGSRGIGNSTAQHYDRLAADLLTKQGIKVPSKLHYMEVASEEGQAYLQV